MTNSDNYKALRRMAKAETVDELSEIIETNIEDGEFRAKINILDFFGRSKPDKWVELYSQIDMMIKSMDVVQAYWSGAIDELALLHGNAEGVKEILLNFKNVSKPVWNNSDINRVINKDIIAKINKILPDMDSTASAIMEIDISLNTLMDTLQILRQEVKQRVSGAVATASFESFGYDDTGYESTMSDEEVEQEFKLLTQKFFMMF